MGKIYLIVSKDNQAICKKKTGKHILRVEKKHSAYY